MNDHEDLGPPAVELQELQEPAAADFLGRVRASIHRRLFVSDTVDFAFRAFFETMFDYLDLIMRSFPGATKPTGKEKD